MCGHAHLFVLVVQDELLCESTLDVRTTFKFLDGDTYYVSIERMPPAPVLMLYDTEVCWSLFDIEGWHAPGEQSACSRVRWPCCCIHFRVVTGTPLASRVYQKPMTCYCCTTDHCGKLLDWCAPKIQSLAGLQYTQSCYSRCRTLQELVLLVPQGKHVLLIQLPAAEQAHPLS